MELLKDYLMSRVISFDKIVDADNYSKMYFKTNEDLDYISNIINFKNKNVLTVLASSDQLFLASSNKAKSIDTFDKNKLALYYYYLRIWTAQYSDDIYPFKIIDNDYNWLSNLLNKVEVKDINEKNALIFWKKHLEDETDFSKLFYDDTIEGKYSISNNELKGISNLKINFKNINLFNKINSNKKYDIIMISNIIEWAKRDKNKLLIIKDNLDELLSDDGIVVHTRLLNRPESIIIEEDGLFDNFECKKYDKNVYCFKKRK